MSMSSNLIGRRTLNTNQADSITSNERQKLRGYCEPCKLWTPFTRGQDVEECGNCQGEFTHRHGYQITTQRTPLVASAKAYKAEKIAS